MVKCSICNKKIGFFEIYARTGEKMLCSDCLIKKNRISPLIKDANNTEQYKGAISMCNLLIKKINLVPKTQQKKALTFAYLSKSVALINLGSIRKGKAYVKKTLEVSPKDKLALGLQKQIQNS